MPPSAYPARSDAGRRQSRRRSHVTFWRIFLPLSLPGVLAGSTLVFVLALGFYITPELLGGGRTIMISMLVSRNVELYDQWGAASAVGVVLLVAVGVIFFAVSRFIPLDRVLGQKCDVPPFPHCPGRDLRAGAALSHPADPDHRADVVLGRALPELSAAVAVAALVRGIFRQSGLDAGDPRDADGCGAHRRYRDPLGVAAAYAISQSKWRIMRLIHVTLLLPLVVPIIITAVGIFFVFAKVGLAATMTGLVLANVMLGLPYVVISVTAGLQSFDATQEMVARSLGMNRLRSFFVVTLPQIKPSVIAGGIFAFISAMDETIVALFISGGQYQPLTKRMFTALRDEIDPTIAAISTLMTAVSFMLVLVATSRSKKST